MIISRTPFRVSFFGGGTDFPAYYREHGGEVLCTTIDKYCYLLVHRLGPYFKHRIRANYAKTETVMGFADIQHPLIRECLRHVAIEDGLEIAHVADLPGRTGLGSSSSFTTASSSGGSGQPTRQAIIETASASGRSAVIVSDPLVGPSLLPSNPKPTSACRGGMTEMRLFEGDEGPQRLCMAGLRLPRSPGCEASARGTASPHRTVWASARVGGPSGRRRP